MIIYRAALCIRWNADDADGRRFTQIIFYSKTEYAAFWVKSL